jgi:hypothetical protein
MSKTTKQILVAESISSVAEPVHNKSNKFKEQMDRALSKTAPYGSNLGSDSFMPRELTRKLQYNEFANMSSTLTTVYTYRLNSLYDPDETGAGSQPLGFDEIMAMYTYFRVEHVKVEIEAVNNSSVPAMLAIAPSISVTDPTSVNDVASMAGSKHSLLSASTGQNRTKFNFNFDIRKILGFKTLNDNDTLGTSSGNPTRMVYLHVAAVNYDTSAKDIYLSTHITYDTRFTNVKQLALS